MKKGFISKVEVQCTKCEGLGKVKTDPMIPCPSCGTELSPDAVMCYACGRLIEKKGNND